MTTAILNCLGWGMGCLVILLVVLVAVLLWRRQRSVPPSEGVLTEVSAPTPIGGQDPRVTARLAAHREDFLAYEIGLVVARNEQSLDVRDKLLRGAAPVFAAPVLELSDLLDALGSAACSMAVDAALEDLGIEPAPEIGGLRAKASASCRRWAEMGAAARYRAWEESRDG